MPVVDTFADTDPPGFRIDLVDDGTVHITGNEMDQALQAEGATSAQQWYSQNAYAFLPLPVQTAHFVEAARALADAAREVTQSAADESAVAEFASAVAIALTAAGEATVPLGMGTNLITLGVTLTVGAARAKPAGEGVLAAAWNNLDQGIDFASLAEHAQQDRTVNAEGRSILQNFSAQAEQVGEAIKGLLEL